MYILRNGRYRWLMWLPQPTEKQIDEFAVLYEAEFGVRLTLEEAGDVAWRFLRLYALFTQAPSKESEEQLRRRVKRHRRQAKRRYMKKHAPKLIKH